MAATVGLTKGGSWGLGPWVALVVFLLAGNASAMSDRPDGLSEVTIVDLRIEGNSSITAEQIRSKMKSRAGRPFNPSTMEEDLRSLEATHWFSDVKFIKDFLAGDRGRMIVTVRVVEMPILKDVQFIGLVEGWGHVKKKDIEEATDLKKGKRADAARAQVAVTQIRDLYIEKGYEKAEVTAGGVFADLLRLSAYLGAHL